MSYDSNEVARLTKVLDRNLGHQPPPEQPKRSYLLQRGGHAGGHLRESLLEALDHDKDWWKHVNIEFFRDGHQRWWDGLNQKQRARWLLGQLWNCTDQLPSEAADEIYRRAPYGNHNRTYAALVRLLAEDLTTSPDDPPDLDSPWFCPNCGWLLTLCRCPNVEVPHSAPSSNLREGNQRALGGKD